MTYKKDFPIFSQVKDLVYLDSAATSQKPQIVLDAMQEYYTTYNANAKRSMYPIAEKATAKIEEVRRKVAKFINAKYPEEIIFVRNTTEAINLVASSWGRFNIKKGDTIATTIMEHHSNFVPWQQLAIEKGAKLEVVDIDKKYNLEFRVKNSELMMNVKLLAVVHASNTLGTINPIKEIILRVNEMNREVHDSSSRPRSNNNIIIVDGAQSIPHMKVDVQDMDCDFLAFSGHKMMAGTGIGILYGKKALLDKMPPFLFGGEMIGEVSLDKTTFAPLPHKFEAGTPDIAGIVSLGAAIDYLDNIGMQNVRNHEKQLVSYAIEQLEKIDGLQIYGSKDVEKRGGAVSFTLEGIHPHDIAHILGDNNICIRAGHHCTMPLHKRLSIPASARASFYIYNTQEDVDCLIKGLKEVKKVFA